MSHAIVNVDVSENTVNVRKSPYSASVGVWVDQDVSLHFRDAGHLGEWLASAREGLSALLDPNPHGLGVPCWHRPDCSGTGPDCAPVDPCGGGSMPDRQGEVEG